MPKVPRLTAAEAEATLFKEGFVWLRSRVAIESTSRAVDGSWFRFMATLHPKIVKQVLEAVAEADRTPPE